MCRVESPTGAVGLLEAGAAILAPVLSPTGFVFRLTDQGRGSGGEFATGRFTRRSQYVEFHVRHSLGLVTYGWGDTTVRHSDYLRGVRVTGTYPGYSDDPLDGFRHLALDLTGPLAGFLNEDRQGYERALSATHQPARRQLP
jgi:hypothetical protein